MKTKKLIFISLCLFATCTTAEETPARNYAFVDVKNGLTCTLLNVGTTSFVFSVEWSPDIELHKGIISLMGNFEADTPWWSNLLDLDLNPANRVGHYASDRWRLRFPVEGGIAYGKATFEVLYDELPWYYWEDDKAKLEQQAFFYVIVPDPDDLGWVPSQEEREELRAFEETKRKQGKAQTSPPSHEEKAELGIENEELEVEKQETPNRLWLYTALAFFLFVMFYLVRRKTRN